MGCHMGIASEVCCIRVPWTNVNFLALDFLLTRRSLSLWWWIRSLTSPRRPPMAVLSSWILWNQVSAVTSPSPQPKQDLLTVRCHRYSHWSFFVCNILLKISLEFESVDWHQTLKKLWLKHVLLNGLVDLCYRWCRDQGGSQSAKQMVSRDTLNSLLNIMNLLLTIH